MQTLWQDLHYGARMLLKRPGMTVIAILTLALGIGANLTIFSFVDTMFFRPLPVREPYRLLTMTPVRGGDGYSHPAYKHFRDPSKSFGALAAHYSTAPLTIDSGGDSRVVSGAVVSANYFPMLGVNAFLGRFFLPEEDAVPDRDRVVVISHRMWQNSFGSDPSVLGKEIQINGTTFKIIGVAPEKFEGVLAGYPNDLWLPSMMVRVGYRPCDALADVECGALGLIGRLASGGTPESAQAEAAMLTSQFAPMSSKLAEQGAKLTPAVGVRAQDRERLRFQMQLMIAVTGLLLLIACANVTGLLLAHGAARRKEIAVRLCIGAGRLRLIRQFLTESLLLTLVAGTLGVIISLWLKQLLLVYYTTSYTTFRIDYDLSLNPRTLLYSLGLTIVVGFLFGLPPAIQATRHDLVRAVKDEGVSPGPGRTRFRSALVVGQVALSLALLIAAALVVRSAGNVRHGANFDPQNVVAMRLRPSLIGYNPEKSQAFFQEAGRRLEVTPGVEAVSMTTSRAGLAWMSGGTVGVRLPEQVQERAEDQLKSEFHEIGLRFFDVLKIPIVQGRDFNDVDKSAKAPVIIVNETLAGRMWPNESPLERVLMVRDQPHRVVGVFKDAQLRNSLEGPLPYLYLPSWLGSAQTDARMVVRVAGDPRAMIPALRREIKAIDPNVPISEDVPLMQQIDAEHRPVLLSSAVLTWSGGLALFLSMIGLYGVLAFAVSSRTREIGVRMALGAQTTDVLKLVVGQGLRLVTIGAFIGLLTAFASTRLIKSLLYGVGATDPLTFAGVVFLLVGIAFVACLLPARRATKVDPMIALRYE